MLARNGRKISKTDLPKLTREEVFQYVVKRCVK